MKYISLILVLLPAVAQAGPLPHSIHLDDVISAVGPNWNSSASFKAVLVREFDDASLYLFHDPFDQTPAAIAPAIAFTGGMWGQIPWLEFDDSGALLVFSENMSVGRNRWQEMVVIERRAQGFFITEYGYNAYDTLNLDNSLDCAIDYENATVTLNGTLLHIDERMTLVPLKNWGPELHAACFQGGE